MLSLHPTRIRRRAAIVLALFASTIALTLVAPMVHADPHAGHAMVSDATGQPDCDHEAPPPVDHTAHCPLCLPVAAPPAFVLPPLHASKPVALACRTHASTRVAASVSAPLPARGPPLRS